MSQNPQFSTHQIQIQSGDQMYQKINTDRSKVNILGLTSLSDNQPYKNLSSVEQIIANNFSRIHKILDQFDCEFQHRFQLYQKQVLAVVKQEIQQMNSQTRKLINDLQEKIMEKQGNQLLWHFRNQSDFFKHQALKLFQTNKDLRLQIKLLKQSLNQYESRFQINDMLLQKLKKRQVKQKQRYSKKISNTKINHSNFTELIQTGSRPIKILKTRQRLQAEASKRLRTQQSIRINHIEPAIITTQDDAVQIVRHRTEVDKDKLLGTNYNNYLQINQFQINCSQPQFKATKIQTQNSRAKVNQSYISQFFQKIEKSTQTDAVLSVFGNQCLNTQTKKNSSKQLRENVFLSKQVNFQKNGFIVNYPSQTKKQKSFRKSSDIYLTRFSREIVHMNESFMKNKLDSKQNEHKKSNQKYSLFAKDKRQ